ncbi:hypothetical protein DL93DRAFT_2089486 [Clavulina sp. PMI_390]|nr:hypothetical protein DL93DRAFT_2089486 [Clavulina sp. PMI_390]
MAGPSNIKAYEDALEDLRVSFSSVRQVVKSALSTPSSELDFKDGISLLSLKNEAMLSYLHSLSLMSCHRILGHSLLDRSPPLESFASSERSARGADAGDLVDHAIESRAVLEKSKAMETRMKYQIDKLVRLSEDTAAAERDVTQDPLAFRPNIENLVTGNTGEDDDQSQSDNDAAANDGIYRPPKVAPMPYNEASGSKGKKARAAPIAKALSSLSHLDPSMPHSESVSGLGGGSATKSSAVRARLEDMTRFEEENMTRLLLNKKESKRRRRDEEDIALGGMGGGRSRGGGLDDEFDDILKSVSRSRSSKLGDGYEDLRSRGKKVDALSRSRMRKQPDDEFGGGGRDRKRTKFAKDVMKVKRRASRK